MNFGILHEGDYIFFGLISSCLLFFSLVITVVIFCLVGYCCLGNQDWYEEEGLHLW